MGHFRTLTFSSLFQHSSRTRSTFHSCFNNHKEFNPTLHRRFLIQQGFNKISSPIICKYIVLFEIAYNA